MIRSTEVLRAAIRDSGLSLQEISRRTAIPASALSRFMTGRRGITFATFEALAPALGLEIVHKRALGEPVARLRPDAEVSPAA